jgi:cation transport ATPase
MTFDKTGTLTLGSFRLIYVELGTSAAPPAASAPAAANGNAASSEPSSCDAGMAAPSGSSSPIGGSNVSDSRRCGADSGSPALSEREVLRLVGSLERGASHPIAAAIVGRAAAQASPD